jgi:hypothetical protein
VTEYIPRDEDKQYALSIAQFSRDGALMRQPCFQLTYRLYASRKELVLIQGDQNSDGHARNVAVFTAIGWTASVKKEPDELVNLELIESASSKRAIMDAAGRQELQELKGRFRNN